MALIIPEVFADVMNAEIGKRIVISKLATDYSDEIDVTTCGDTAHLPILDRLTDAKVINSGDTVEFDEISMTDNIVKIEQHAKGVTILDKDDVQIKGNAKALLAEQLGEVMALSLDGILAKDIVSNAAYKIEAASITEFTPAKMDAAMSVFGDQIAVNSFAGIVLNSKLYGDISKWDEFTSVVKTYNAVGNGIVQENGLIGYWRAIPVYVSDCGTSDENNVYCFIIKKNALAVLWQRVPKIEEHRNLGKIATDILASDLVGAKLARTNGVSLISVKAGE